MSDKPTLKFELTPYEYLAVANSWRLAQICIKHMQEDLSPADIAELRDIIGQLELHPEAYFSAAAKLKQAAREAGEGLLSRMIMTGKPTLGLVDLLSRFDPKPTEK